MNGDITLEAHWHWHELLMYTCTSEDQDRLIQPVLITLSPVEMLYINVKLTLTSTLTCTNSESDTDDVHCSPKFFTVHGHTRTR